MDVLYNLIKKYVFDVHSSVVDGEKLDIKLEQSMKGKKTKQF